MSLAGLEVKPKGLPTPYAAGVWAAIAAAAAVIAAGPVSALWGLHAYHRSPGARRVEATLMSSRASRAFDGARTAISALVAARTLEDRRKAASALKAAERDFSRDMTKAAATSFDRRGEILARKTQGEIIIGSACAPWTEVVPPAAPAKASRAAAQSTFLYFSTCLTATTRFQQALDDQTASLVADMTRAAGVPVSNQRPPRRT